MPGQNRQDHLGRRRRARQNDNGSMAVGATTVPESYHAEGRFNGRSHMEVLDHHMRRFTADLDRVYHERQAQRAPRAQYGSGPGHSNTPNQHQSSVDYDGHLYSQQAQAPSHNGPVVYYDDEGTDSDEEGYNSADAHTNRLLDTPNDNGSAHTAPLPEVQPEEYVDNRLQYYSNQHDGQHQGVQGYDNYSAARQDYDESNDNSRLILYEEPSQHYTQQDYGSDVNVDNQYQWDAQGNDQAYYTEGHHQGLSYDSSNVYTGGPAYGGSPSTFLSGVPTNVLQYHYYQVGQSYAPNQGDSSDEE